MHALQATPSLDVRQARFTDASTPTASNVALSITVADTPKPSDPPVNPAPKPKGDFDVLNSMKAVAGLLPRLIDHLEAEARTTRVPVSEPLFIALLARTSPGVTVAGMVERAIAAFLDDTATETPAPCSCHADQPAGTKPADDAKLARLLFNLSPLCRGCQKVMTHHGKKDDRPTLHHAADGPQLLCAECAGWIAFSGKAVAQ